MDTNTFISRLSEKTGLDDKNTSVLIDSMAKVFTTSLAALDSVAIPGFGKFESVKENETISVDLSSGKRMLMPPVIEIKFVPASLLNKTVFPESK